MAKVLIFFEEGKNTDKVERNNKFRTKVLEFLPYILKRDEAKDFKTYTCNTPISFCNAFSENPDCIIVFATEENAKAIWEGNLRKKNVYKYCKEEDIMIHEETNDVAIEKAKLRYKRN